MKLYKDFVYDDDTVVRQLEHSLEELKKNKLDHPGPPGKEELPSREFGMFKEPTFEQIVGIRAEKFTEKEKETNNIVTLTSEAARESVEKDKDCQLSVGDSVGFTGTENSLFDSRTTLNSVSSICDSLDLDDEWTRL